MLQLSLLDRMKRIAREVDGWVGHVGLPLFQNVLQKLIENITCKWQFSSTQFYSIQLNLSHVLETFPRSTTYNCITIVILFCESNRVTHLKTRISSYIKYISAIAMAKQVGPEHWGKGNLLWSPTGSTTWSLQSTILYMLIWYTYG